MPQLDTTYYLSSVLWFLVSFSLLFAFIRVWVMPRLNGLASERKRRIETKLREILTLRNSITTMEDEYSLRLSTAKEKAALTLKAAFDEFDKQRAKTLAEMEAQCRETLEREAKKFQRERESVVVNLEKVSKDVSREIVAKLTG